MPLDITYQELQNGTGFCATYHGQKIGEIHMVRVGVDRLIIESTQMNENYEENDVCYNLVKCVVQFARRTHRRILCFCPRAQSVFNRYPEFDDVRMIRVAA